MLLEPYKDIFKKFDIIYNILDSELSKNNFYLFQIFIVQNYFFNSLNGINIHICSTLDKIKDYISYIKEKKKLDKNIFSIFM